MPQLQHLNKCFDDLVVDAGTGVVVDFMLSGPDNTMSEALASGLVHAIERSGVRPASLRSDSAMMVKAIEPLIKALESKIVHVKSIPMALEARRSLEAYSSQD